MAALVLVLVDEAAKSKGVTLLTWSDFLLQKVQFYGEVLKFKRGHGPLALLVLPPMGARILHSLQLFCMQTDKDSILISFVSGIMKLQTMILWVDIARVCLAMETL